MSDAKKCQLKMMSGREDNLCSSDCAWYCNEKWCVWAEIAAIRGDIANKISQNKK